MAEFFPGRCDVNEDSYADADAVADFAAGLTEAYLHCRELSHNWKPHSVIVADDGISYERSLRCNRCKTKRVQILDRFGAVHSSHYEYPEGYLSDGLGRIAGEGRDRLRLETTMRMMKRNDERLSA